MSPVVFQVNESRQIDGREHREWRGSEGLLRSGRGFPDDNSGYDRQCAERRDKQGYCVSQILNVAVLK